MRGELHSKQDTGICSDKVLLLKLLLMLVQLLVILLQALVLMKGAAVGLKIISGWCLLLELQLLLLRRIHGTSFAAYFDDMCNPHGPGAADPAARI